MKSGVLERAMPGRENAKDWLTMKIVECMAQPMTDKVAECLSVYNSAYNAICQWGGESLAESEPSVASAPGPAPNPSSICPDDAKSWMRTIKNADGTSGAHWTLEQSKEIMAKRSLVIDPYDFWVSLNMIYSSFAPVAKKHGVGGSMDFYVDMATAWLGDGGVSNGKASVYYNTIARI